MTKISCWLRFGYPASLLQTNFPLPRLKKWGLFWVRSVFTVEEVGGLTGVVFSIYKSTLILNIKLINNFCLHTHLFHKIRGKGLLELHFVSIMHLLTASYLDTIYLALTCSRPLTLVFSWISMLAPVHTYPLHWQQDVTSISCNYFQRKEKKTEISDVSFPFIYLHFSYCIYVDYYIIPPGRLFVVVLNCQNNPWQPFIIRSRPSSVSYPIDLAS